MNILKKKLSGVLEMIPSYYEDERGFLVRMYDKKVFKDFGITSDWMQESHSYTRKKGTIRGLHVSLPPFLETKLIKAITGEMLWIIVDLRKDFPTFGKWESIMLSDKLKNLLYIPRGFAHGCISLSDNCNLVIKADNFFSPNVGTGIKWDDPELNINWGLKGNLPFIISEKDKNYPSFKEFKEKYGGIVID